MMPRDAIATCPICAGELAVTRLHCRACGTTLEGDFSVGRFARLGREQFGLLETFLRSRGNLKDMERELGISYPTVRARVDALLRALGLGDGPAGESEPVGRTDDMTQPMGRVAEAARTAGGAPAAAGTATSDGSGTSETADRAAAARRLILERLARHEIDAATAALELRAVGGQS